MRKRFDLRNLSVLASIDKKGFILNGCLLVVSAVMVFITDILFALSLQRFFVSTGLLNDLANTRFFGDIRAPYIEALILQLVLFARLMSVGINSAIAGYGYSRFEKNVRIRIASSVFTTPTNDVSKISYVFNEIAVGSSNFVSTVYLILSRFSIMIFLLASLMFYSWFITLLILIACILIYPLQMKFGSRILLVSTEILRLSEATSNIVLGGARNYIFLNIRGATNLQFQKVSRNLRKILVLRERFYLFTAIRSSIPQFVGVSFLVIVAASPLVLKLDNRTEIIPFLYLLLRFFVSLGDILRAGSHIRLDLPRIQDLIDWISKNKQVLALEEKSQNRKSHELSLPSFSVDNVMFQSHVSEPPLVYKNIRIPAGQISLIRGSNGSGKSTLILLLAGVLKPTQGEIRRFFSVSKQPEFLYEIDSEMEFIENSRMSYVGPNPTLISGTIFENLIYGLDKPCSISEIESAAKAIGLFEISDSSFTLDKKISENGRGLSAGQIQQIAWVRAILTKPNLLLLDEATSNLDTISKTRVYDWLIKEKGNITTVMIDHTIDNYSWVDKLIDLY